MGLGRSLWREATQEGPIRQLSWDERELWEQGLQRGKKMKRKQTKPHHHNRSGQRNSNRNTKRVQKQTRQLGVETLNTNKGSTRTQHMRWCNATTCVCVCVCV